MKNISREPKIKFSTFHLIELGIFILSLVIRIYGVYSINFTNSEAEIILPLLKIESSGSSFFYGLLMRVLLFFQLDCMYGMRIVNAVMGAILTTFPVLFHQEIGKRTAVLTSLFFTMDPFGIANSIAFSGNIATIFFLGLLIDTLLHGRRNLILMAILLLLGHGRGLGYFIIFILLFLIYIFILKRSIFSNLLTIIRDRITQKTNDKEAGLLIILVLILSIVFKVRLSNIATDISNFISGWGTNYVSGNYPIVYLYAIISVIPLAVFLSANLLFFYNREKGSNSYFFIIWLSITLIIMFYPKHLILDLIWISIPLWFSSAIILDKFISRITFYMIDWPFILVFSLIGITFNLNLIAYIYRSVWNLDTTNSLLAILIIGIFMIILLLYRAFTSTLSKALISFMIVLIIFGGITQIAFSTRALGMNRKPENEIFWNGYFEGKDIFEGIFSTTKHSLKGTEGKLNVYVDGQASPAEIWAVRSENIKFLKSDLSMNPPDIVITKDPIFYFNEDTFQNQKYVSSSYPLWLWDPIGSFFLTDFWNWFFFRNNLQYKEYHFISVNSTSLNKKINIGAY